MKGVGAWGAGALGLVGVVALGTASLAPVGDDGDRSTVAGYRSSVTTPAQPYPAESLGTVVISRDVFRVTRRAADVAYDPVRLAQVALQPPAPKPVLVLTGIVWGAEPQAVVEGWPGVEGPRVVRAGDVVSGLKVKRIDGTRVTVVGMDTTWVLQVREPWKN